MKIKETILRRPSLMPELTLTKVRHGVWEVWGALVICDVDTHLVHIEYPAEVSEFGPVNGSTYRPRSHLYSPLDYDYLKAIINWKAREARDTKRYDDYNAACNRLGTLKTYVEGPRYYRFDDPELGYSYYPHWFPKWHAKKMRKIYSKALKPIYTDLLAMLTEEEVTAHKLLYSVKGTFPSAASMLMASRMKYKTDLEHWACRLYVTEREGEGFTAHFDNIDWIGRYMADALTEAKWARRRLYRAPGGTTYRDIVSAICEGFVSLPETRRAWVCAGVARGRFFMYYDGGEWVRLLRLLCRSSAKDFDRAVYVAVDALGLRTEVRKYATLRQAFEWILDAPVPASDQASILTYARVSLEWHMNGNFVPTELEGSRFDNGPWAPPVVDLPEGFVHLDTQQALTDEGNRMLHCVGSYGPRCANGDTYIFSYKESVTVELDCHGQVRQCYAHRNSTTPACDTAREVLNRWASSNEWQPRMPFPQAGKHPVYDWDGDELPF